MRVFIDTPLRVLLGKDKLRDQPSVGQAALKVMPAQETIVAFNYRVSSSVSKPSCGQIELPDYGQAASFKSGGHFPGFKETRLLVACPR